MECYSQQTCALFVDGELAADAGRRLRASGHVRAVSAISGCTAGRESHSQR
jgi:hypothetical protein